MLQEVRGHNGSCVVPADMRILLRIATRASRSYDANVPNKTIYVSDGDLSTYQRAQELAGGNLSAAIAAALRRYVDVEEGRREGFDEIVVRVGPGKGRKVRFVGVLLGEWANSSSSYTTFRVYRGRSGKFVLHIDRGPGFTMVNAQGKPAGWRGHLGIGDVSYGSSPAESTLDVVGSLEELRERIPPQLYDMVARSAQQPPVEDLDI
jgi:EXLDI family protein